MCIINYIVHQMLLFRRFFGLNTRIIDVIIFVSLWCWIIFVLTSKYNTPSISEQENTFPWPNTSMIMESLESKQIMDGDEIKIDQSKPQHTSNGKNEPNMEYERLRRRVRGNTQELWNYVNSELNKIKKKLSNNNSELIDEIANVMELGAEHKRSLISDIDQMRMVDGHEEWRYEEAKSLSDLVQRRLHYLQNPRDCKNASKIVCKLPIECGVGCQLHHIVQYLIVAYATESTLFLVSKSGIYNITRWEDFLRPVSETCLDIDPYTSGKVRTIPIRNFFLPPQPYLPLAIPADLAARLMRLHGDPIVWWVGEFLKYLLRPSDATHGLFKTRMEKLGFKKPIVGVHVRRTDKLDKEADYHGIEEYMTYVEDYFLQLEVKDTNVKRRVFLATDEASVIDEAKEKYPSYEIIGDPAVAEMAKESTRYSDSSLNGIVSDIHILSLCDYLVCTFSSSVCRVAYEIMQTMYPDASTHFKSLDDIYFFAGQHFHYRETVLSHHPRHSDEIDMKPGDQIDIAGNHWDGYSKGINTRTDQTGLFPSFKVNDKVVTEEFPTYPNVK